MEWDLMQASSSTISSEKEALSFEALKEQEEKGRGNRKNRLSAAACIAVSAALILGVLALLQALLMPKYMGKIVEGAMVAEYYGEVKDHDMVFVGDCELYENFDPVYLWKQYGINSYIRGSAQQLIWQSYYLMEETLQYEHPKVMVFNVLSLQYNEPQKESYNRMTLDGMRWSKTKIDDINASMTKGEQFLDYVFPILRFHSRWKELEQDDFTYLFHKRQVTFNGYYMRTDVKPAENVPEGKPLGNYNFGDNAWDYMDRIVKLCRDNDVQLLLVKAPSLYPFWYPQWEEQVEEYAAANHLEYINFLELTEETGLDFQTDTYDAGLHLNLSGADKISDYFGGLLAKGNPEYGREAMPDRRGEPELSSRWEEKIKAYEAEIRRQKENPPGIDP